MRVRTIVMAGAVAASAALLLRRAGIREDLDWETVDKPGQLIDIDGYSVHYIEQGTGPAMVLVHGFGGQTFSYRRLIPAFARDHRVIAVDLKGYGYSERSSRTGLTHTAQATMLKSLLDQLGVAHATFIGHSMGGAVVQRFAVAYPDMVDALVLAASASADDRVSHRLAPPAIVFTAIAPLMARLVSSRLLEGSYFDKAKLTADVRAEYLRPQRIKGSMEGLLAILQQAANEPPVDLSRITQPVLILNGADDRIVRSGVSRRLGERLPHARTVVVGQAGHMLLEEQPEECERAIRDFLHESPADRERAASYAS